MTGRLLVAYSNASNHVPTTADYLESIHRYSKFDVCYVHVTNGAELDFDLNEFDAVFQSYCARLPFDGHVSPDFLSALRSFRGVKLIAVQDEYDRTDKVRQAVRQIGYHVFLSVVPPAMLERIYPPEMFPQTEFVSVLTGYVPERLERLAPALPLRDRPVIIGYRGRDIGARYGALGFEKVEIGRRMREICVERDIAHDIEWDDAKRIYGDAWYDFIGSCRAILGSESGSNVFDFDGSIEAKYAELSAARSGPLSYDEFRPYTEPFDSEYNMRQISPRVFEAAAMHTPMILFSGCYSGLLQPGEHFIELKKDFSNVESVLAQLDDLDGLEQMAERAHQHLVRSGEFGYSRFVELIDGIILRKAAELGTSLRPALKYSSASSFNNDFLAEANLRERPTKEPRHPIFYHYKQAAAVYPGEVKRLNSMISQVQSEYAAEAKRLNGIIDRIQREYTDEVRRLNNIIIDIQNNYTGEIERLNRIIVEQQAEYTAEVARLNAVINELQGGYTSELARLNAVIANLPRAARAAAIAYLKGVLKRRVDERLLNRTKLLLRSLKQSR